MLLKKHKQKLSYGNNLYQFYPVCWRLLSSLIQGCPRSQGSLGTQGNSENFKFTENIREFINRRKSHGNPERLMEVLRLKKSQKHLFQASEWDLVDPIWLFKQKKKIYLFLSAYLEIFSLAASSSNSWIIFKNSWKFLLTQERIFDS